MELNRLLAELLRHKPELIAVIQSQDPDKIARGRLELPASLLNGPLRPMILANAGGVLADYTVDFRDGVLGLAAQADVRQLGPLDLSYRIRIQEFRFDGSRHMLTATFEENVESRGNIAQKLALKAAMMGGSLLGTAVKLGNPPGLLVDGNRLMADFDRMPFKDRIPDGLTLSLAGLTQGVLALDFTYR
jgi:hypothetical protein